MEEILTMFLVTITLIILFMLPVFLSLMAYKICYGMGNKIKDFREKLRKRNEIIERRYNGNS